MPLVKRTVSPVNVSRGTIPAGLNRDELQCVANGTLANLIRQLSSLSNHAENIFGDIYRDAMKLHHKSRNLEQRIERLMHKAVQLDSTGEQATLGEIQMRKAFKSSMLVDQHTLDRETLPLALSAVYNSCDPPPNLDALNPYRDDPTSALSLYTNPSFFFDLWRKEMLKDCGDGRRRMKSPTDGSKSPKKRRRAVQQPSQDLPRPAANRLISHRPAHGVMSFPEEYQAPQALGLQLHRHHGGQFQPLQTSSPILPPPGMSARAPPLMIERNDARPDVSPQTEFMKRDLPPPDLSLLGIDDDDDLPPPPPPLMHTSIVQQIQPENTIQLVPADKQTMSAPPPPPPPPPANLPPISAPATFAVSASAENRAEKRDDPMNNMLAQIREGRTLRKVNREAEEAARAAAEENDVAAILRRRMEHVLGNDDDSISSGGDSEEWDD